MEKSNAEFVNHITGCEAISPEMFEGIILHLSYRPDDLDKQSTPGSHCYVMRPQQAREMARLLIQRANEADRMSSDD